jgi:hypothetical protein
LRFRIFIELFEKPQEQGFESQERFFRQQCLWKRKDRKSNCLRSKDEFWICNEAEFSIVEKMF